jgi:hypothetical protein
MNYKIRLLTLLVSLTGFCNANEQTPTGQWTIEKAMVWHKSQPWLVGCNFTAEPELWHHDILRPDGTPHRQSEVVLIKSLVSAKP